MSETSSLKDKISVFENTLKTIIEYVNNKMNLIISENLKIHENIQAVSEEIKLKTRLEQDLDDKINRTTLSIEDLSKQIESLEKDLDNVNSGIEKTKTSVNENKVKLKTLTSSFKDLENQRNDLTSRLEELMNKIEEVKNETKKIKLNKDIEKNRFLDELNRVKKEVEELKTREALLNYLAVESASTPPEALILATLIARQQATIKEIQDLSGQPPSIITRGIRSLEEKGIITVTEQTVKLNKPI